MTDALASLAGSRTALVSPDSGHPGGTDILEAHSRTAVFAILYGPQDNRLAWLRAGADRQFAVVAEVAARHGGRRGPRGDVGVRYAGRRRPVKPGPGGGFGLPGGGVFAWPGGGVRAL
jgi:hypothetical protein